MRGCAESFAACSLPYARFNLRGWRRTVAGCSLCSRCRPAPCTPFLTGTPSSKSVGPENHTSLIPLIPWAANLRDRAHIMCDQLRNSRTSRARPARAAGGCSRGNGFPGGTLAGIAVRGLRVVPKKKRRGSSSPRRMFRVTYSANARKSLVSVCSPVCARLTIVHDRRVARPGPAISAGHGTVTGMAIVRALYLGVTVEIAVPDLRSLRPGGAALSAFGDTYRASVGLLSCGLRLGRRPADGEHHGQGAGGAAERGLQRRANRHACSPCV